MINTNVFNYINVMEKAADAAWLRDEAISNNIANVDTPGYKRQDVSFEAELGRALRSSRSKTLDDKVGDLNLNSVSLKGRPYRDHANFSYRIDKNNVDIDTENVELASNQLKYDALIQSMTSEFTMLKSVCK